MDMEGADGVALVHQRNTQDRAVIGGHVHGPGIAVSIGNDGRLAGERLCIEGAMLHCNQLSLPEHSGETGDRRHCQVRAPCVQQADRYRVRLQCLSDPIGQAAQKLL